MGTRSSISLNTVLLLGLSRSSPGISSAWPGAADKDGVRRLSFHSTSPISSCGLFGFDLHEILKVFFGEHGAPPHFPVSYSALADPGKEGPGTNSQEDSCFLHAD